MRWPACTIRSIFTCRGVRPQHLREGTVVTIPLRTHPAGQPQFAGRGALRFQRSLGKFRFRVQASVWRWARRPEPLRLCRSWGVPRLVKFRSPNCAKCSGSTGPLCRGDAAFGRNPMSSDRTTCRRLALQKTGESSSSGKPRRPAFHVTKRLVASWIAMLICCCAGTQPGDNQSGGPTSRLTRWAFYFQCVPTAGKPKWIHSGHVDEVSAGDDQTYYDFLVDWTPHQSMPGAGGVVWSGRSRSGWGNLWGSACGAGGRRGREWWRFPRGDGGGQVGGIDTNRTVCSHGGEAPEWKSG